MSVNLTGQRVRAAVTNPLVRGCLAGTIATGIMTLLIEGGRAGDLFRTSPPEEITARAEAAVGVSHELSEPAFHASWGAAHVAYGALCGVGFALARPLLPASTVLAGLLFGGTVWAVSYLGVLPRLQLYPPIRVDAPARVAVMLAAHAAFGIATAEAARRLSGARRAGR